MSSFVLFSLLITSAASVAVSAAPNPEPLPSNIRERFLNQQPGPHLLVDPDHFIWCLSAFCGDDGRVHAYYSRWPKSRGFAGWMTHCEIMHAVADTPAGPFTTTGTVIASRNAAGWDAVNAHNPYVCVVDGTIYLYYISNDLRGKHDGRFPDDEWLSRNRDVVRNSQRIGLATATRPEGPFSRTPEPVVVPQGGFKNIAVNPAVIHHDGKFHMIIKGDDARRDEVFRIQFAAHAEHAQGPFTIHPEPLFGEAQTEDACLWFNRNDGRFHCVLHVMGQPVLAHLHSKDGLGWEKAEPFTFLQKEFQLADGTVWRPRRVERPFVLTDDQGRPAWIFLAVEDAGKSGNIVLRMKKVVEGSP